MLLINLTLLINLNNCSVVHHIIKFNNYYDRPNLMEGSLCKNLSLIFLWED